MTKEDLDLKEFMLRAGGGKIDNYLTALKSGYRQSKCVAELLVHKARKMGLPVNVFRCGMIAGESSLSLSPVRPGRVANDSDWVSRLLCGVVHMRSYPFCSGALPRAWWIRLPSYPLAQAWSSTWSQ